MNVINIKRDNPLVRYIRIAFREAVIWNYTPFLCIPVVWLTLFFIREEYFSDDGAKLGLIGVSYGIILLLGICMGMVASGHLFNGRRGETYGMLPYGRRSIMAVRLITMLVLSLAVICATYVVFYFFTGINEPYFYSYYEAYKETVTPSTVTRAEVTYSGVSLWCVYGIMAFSEAAVPFIMGYAIGALCAVLSSFVIFSVFHAVILLAINAVAIANYTAGLRVNGIKYDTLAIGFSPIWFITYVFNGANVSINSFAWGWITVSGIFILLAVLLSKYVGIERRRSFLNCRKFIIFYAVFIILSAAVFFMREYAPNTVALILERIFGVRHYDFGN